MSQDQNTTTNPVCRILFWNINRSPINDIVVDIAIAQCVDLIVLAECAQNEADTLKKLQNKVDHNFFIPSNMSSDRFHFFCRNQKFDLTEVHKGQRTSYRRLQLGATTTLIGFVHGYDIRNHDIETRQALAQKISDEMQFVQSQQNNNRLFLMGDFNINPYDRGMNLALGFNAMMTKNCTHNGQRTFKEQKYDFYYNPMWSLFGDGSDGPAGTYYDRSSQGPYGWSMLDQVIISHSIIAGFKSVQILTNAGQYSLLDSRGHPNKTTASDHLPILVELNDPEYD